MKLFFTLPILLFFVSENTAIAQADSLKPSAIPAITSKSEGGQKQQVVVRLACRATVADADPLLVVDGVPYEFGHLKEINVNDIQSIDILKDATASAIYGYRAARGVIIITTKQASERKFIVRDFLTGEKIAAATICFTSGNDSLTTLADENGVVITDKLKPAGKYTVTVSSAGYKTLSTQVTKKEQELLLERDVKLCPGVVVTCNDCSRTIRCGMTISVTREKALPDQENLSITQRVYPNPVQRNNTVYLEINGDKDETIRVSIVNMAGSLVFSKQQKIVKGYNRLSVNVDARWASGINIIRLQDQKGKLLTQDKLLVQ